MELTFTVADYLSACEFYGSLPSRQQKLFDRFPPGSRWKLRAHSSISLERFHPYDWFVPMGYTDAGRIEVCRIDHSTGMPTFGNLTVRTSDLVPFEH